MTKGLKTAREQQLAINLFSERIKLLDEQFSGFLKITLIDSKPLRSFNNVIKLTTENPTLGPIPVIIFSAYLHPDVDFMDFGCDAVIINRLI